jgi:predicted transcriptional regulator
MRTTIEIADELRARLLALAARRGEKGFSGIVGEAIERYLTAEELREDERRKDAALASLGSLSDEEAEALEERTKRLRETWR